MAFFDLIAGATAPGAAASYEGGSAPSGGSDVRWMDGSADISTSLTGLAAIDLISLIVGPDFGGNIGTSSTPVQLQLDQTSTGTLIIYGAGEFANIAGSSAAIEIAIIQFRPSNGMHLTLATCTTTTVSLESGSSVIRSSVIVSTVIAAGSHSGTLEAHASDLCDALRVHGDANYRLERDWTAAHLGGRATLTIDLTSPGGAAGGSLDMNGGTFVPVRGDFGTFNGYAGVVDATKLKKTVTAAAGVVHPGLVVRKYRTGPQFDYSACTVIAGGPRVEFMD